MDNTATPLLWYRGVGYFNLQRYDLALQDFKESYIVNPNHVHVLNNLATIYEIKGKHNKAKEYYYKALEVIPTFKESRVNLAAILFNEKEYEQALDVILESKVYPYWRRKKEGDNYDKYLKIIVNSWANSLINKSEEEKLRIKNILNSFDKNPNFAEKRMREIKLNRDNLDISYLDALVETYKK
jgi:Tfp pilus assembly protein PilF